MSETLIDQPIDDTDYLYEEFLKTANDWKTMFRSHEDFCDALHHTSNPKHELAKRIKANKDSKLNNDKSFDEIKQRSIDNYYSNLPNWAR